MRERETGEAPSGREGADPRETGRRIRARRRTLGLDQKALAARIGISPAYLSLIENGRRKAPKALLERLAAALDMAPAQLLGVRTGADWAEVLATLAARHRPADPPRPEIAHAERLVAEYPGWARLVIEQGREIEALEARLAILADRLSGDPYLADTLHALLSSVTAVQASADILARTPELAPAEIERFRFNLSVEARRTADRARALLEHFDRSRLDRPLEATTPREEVMVLLARHDHHFPAIEAAGNASSAAARAAAREVAGALGAELSAEARPLLHAALELLAEDAAALPLSGLAAALEAVGLDPAVLCARLDVAPARLFRRLVALGAKEGDGPMRELGLVAFDRAGVVLWRHQGEGLTLPRLRAACALWPVFRARADEIGHHRLLTDRGTPIEAWTAVEIRRGAEGVARRISWQLVRQIRHDAGHGGGSAAGRQLVVGASCRLCRRASCPERREPAFFAPPVPESASGAPD